MSRNGGGRAVLVAASASGQGKTLVTAALARLLVRSGHTVRVFKSGPDFLDPMLLARACGAPVHTLDLWMAGEAHGLEQLRAADREAEWVIIEGVMGLYDGDPSGAELAQRFGLPVALVVDGTGMARTFGAVAHGLATYTPHPDAVRVETPASTAPETPAAPPPPPSGVRLAGVLANRVASAHHAALLQDSLPPSLPWLGALPRDPALALPSRHLGLVQAEEVDALDALLDRAADLLAPQLPQWQEHCRWSSSRLPEGPAPAVDTPPRLAGWRVAIARDPAFRFLYPANVDWLQQEGAEIRWFSPCADEPLPDCDTVYLPGGYPELHLPALSASHTTQAGLRAHHAAGRPIVAECGGMLYLARALTDTDGVRTALTGLLPAEATLQTRLAGLGLHALPLPGGSLRGHVFHYSTLACTLTPAGHTTPARRGRQPVPVWRTGSLFASYLHLYFPSAPAAAAQLLRPDRPAADADPVNGNPTT